MELELGYNWQWKRWFQAIALFSDKFLWSFHVLSPDVLPDRTGKEELIERLPM